MGGKEMPMGEVIRKNAATVDILAYARTTLNNAKQRGGDVQRLAEEKLAPTLLLAEDVTGRMQTASTEAAPLIAALDAENDVCDDLLARVQDDVWNLVGRPASDPALDVIFPGGIGYYAEGEVNSQPARMLLLAELIRASIHPRIPAERATAFAAEITEGANRLRAKAEAAATARDRANLLKRMQTALARTTQLQLAALKRLYKAHGLSEADIHRVIPDSPRPVPRAAETAQS
jgi:hypothetical protein